MTVSLCKHSHIVLPPHGSIFRPSDCTRCGLSYNAIQEELQLQKEALIHGASKTGTCPDCQQERTLLRFQPPEQPWDPFDYEPPVSFLCLPCYNTAAVAYNESIAGLLGSV
ncbi:hypothetical protein EAO70_20790 [Streptomyces sp. adm13(2018)]|uniref:hypothetical protein n=1 Tax=Streptomyces sp. adm13(2018) TaxID=2479007 RepID=UPI0011CDB4B3|nr:hypothetical protein [Streptomyces sp. adm13(2018)]TXS14022.1 hypothetical protein EAO70_20790 [Streptomyces sp. adm13(2018)]